MHMDHDYTALYPGMKTEPGRAWIDEDAPPLVKHYLKFYFGCFFTLRRPNRFY